MLIEEGTGYDESVDIWGLGCCLYEMVDGQPPFRNGIVNPDLTALKPQILEQDVDLKPWFSKDFKSLI